MSIQSPPAALLMPAAKVCTNGISLGIRSTQLCIKTIFERDQMPASIPRSELETKSKTIQRCLSHSFLSPLLLLLLFSIARAGCVLILEILIVSSMCANSSYGNCLSVRSNDCVSVVIRALILGPACCRCLCDNFRSVPAGQPPQLVNAVTFPMPAQTQCCSLGRSR